MFIRNLCLFNMFYFSDYIFCYLWDNDYLIYLLIYFLVIPGFIYVWSNMENFQPISGQRCKISRCWGYISELLSTVPSLRSVHILSSMYASLFEHVIISWLDRSYIDVFLKLFYWSIYSIYIVYIWSIYMVYICVCV